MQVDALFEDLERTAVDKVTLIFGLCRRRRSFRFTVRTAAGASYTAG